MRPKWLLSIELIVARCAMNGEIGNPGKESAVDEDVELAEEPEDTIVFDDAGDIDNVGDISVEIDVEELVAKIEASEGEAAEHQKEIRHRLDEIEERRKAEKELDNTYNFNLDDDL
jgi:hypothetical protein